MLKVKRHPLQVNDKYCSLIDVFVIINGEEKLLTNMHVDTLGDMLEGDNNKIYYELLRDNKSVNLKLDVGEQNAT